MPTIALVLQAKPIHTAASLIALAPKKPIGSFSFGRPSNADSLVWKGHANKLEQGCTGTPLGEGDEVSMDGRLGGLLEDAERMQPMMELKRANPKLGLSV